MAMSKIDRIDREIEKTRMSRDELMNFLRGGGNDAPPVETAYHEQEDMTDDEE